MPEGSNTDDIPKLKDYNGSEEGVFNLKRSQLLHLWALKASVSPR